MGYGFGRYEETYMRVGMGGKWYEIDAKRKGSRRSEMDVTLPENGTRWCSQRL